MRRLTVLKLFRRFRSWDLSAQIGFAFAFVLIIFLFIVGNWGPDAVRTPALIGIMGLIICAQAIFMWANRVMVTPYTLAQKHYLNGMFDKAKDVLESLYKDGKSDVYSLTLLGNTYRQLGDLIVSKAILYEALNMNPQHYFPLYGFGRTLLSEGHYTEAIDAIQKAIEYRAESIVYFDLAEAFYRDGQMENARTLLVDVLPQLKLNEELHRLMMAQYWLFCLGQGERPSKELINDGLPFWEHQAELFAHTPYGQAIAHDIHNLKHEP